MFSILEVDSPEWASRLEALPPHLRDDRLRLGC
jgi:hypothetical protein